jgi:hypothetical protein
VGTPGLPGISGRPGAPGAPSDVRLKKDIKRLENPLSGIRTLRGVTFKWKNPKKGQRTTEEIGFIAQEVEKNLPHVVIELEDEMPGDPTKYKGLEYGKLVPLCVEAIKELDATVADLKARIEKLEKNQK